jgi:CRISPR-associated protein Csd1
MTVLQALSQYYGRMVDRGEADPPGYSRESIGLCIWLHPDGVIAKVEDLHDYSRGEKKPFPRRETVPKGVGRTSGVSANFLWDKTGYALGVASKEKEVVYKRKEHDAFKALHRNRLAGLDDPGFQALLAFLDAWEPEQFLTDPRFTQIMIDKNVVFGLATEKHKFLHQRPAAHPLIVAPSEVWATGMCLVTGKEQPIERIHTAIRGVEGAQPTGALLVSYNADAFNSYGAKKGANAPTSVDAVFRYTTALNRMLDRTSANKMRIGDSTVLFWADAAGVGEVAAQEAENMIGHIMNPPSDAEEAKKIHDVLVDVSMGRALDSIDPKLNPGTIFHILGISPNAARLSVRYWLTGEIGKFATHMARHYQDISIEPSPWEHRVPSVKYLLVKATVRSTGQRDEYDNIQPKLAGEMIKSILEGTPYPHSLLSAVIARLRAGDKLNGYHAALIKAYINRQNSQEALPVTRDVDSPYVSYQLGRLFAILEIGQRISLGRVNASIADRFYGGASATPARVFPSLLRLVRHHISAAIKRDRRHVWVELRLNEIMSKLPADLPKSLNLVDQGRFSLGYYHERSWRKPADNTEIVDPTEMAPKAA